MEDLFKEDEVGLADDAEEKEEEEVGEDEEDEEDEDSVIYYWGQPVGAPDVAAASSKKRAAGADSTGDGAPPGAGKGAGKGSGKRARVLAPEGPPGGETSEELARRREAAAVATVEVPVGPPGNAVFCPVRPHIQAHQPSLSSAGTPLARLETALLPLRPFISRHSNPPPPCHPGRRVVAVRRAPAPLP